MFKIKMSRLSIPISTPLCVIEENCNEYEIS